MLCPGLPTLLLIFPNCPVQFIKKAITIIINLISEKSKMTSYLFNSLLNFLSQNIEGTPKHY